MAFGPPILRLYSQDEGRILLDGMDLSDRDEEILRQRVGVIFQDFSRYQFLVGENIGAGDVRQFEELMELNGHYANLFSLQAAGYK